MGWSSKLVKVDHGVIKWDPFYGSILGGSNLMQIYGDVAGFPHSCIVNDPCWWVMTPVDEWWPLLMSDDPCWWVMTPVDEWWPLLMSDDPCWWVMTPVDEWWPLLMSDDPCWWVMTPVDEWWPLLMSDDPCWWVMTPVDEWWPLLMSDEDLLMKWLEVGWKMETFLAGSCGRFGWNLWL